MSSSHSLAGSVRRGLRAAHEMLSDLPYAMRQERNYRTGRRCSAILSLTWRCTSRCSSCTAWRRPDQRQAELTIDQWLQIGEKLLRSGIRSVEFFGGDVLLRKDLVYALAALLKKGGCDIFMASNSNLLDEPTAQHLVQYLRALALSTDGLDQTHDVLRGTAGCSGRVRRALEFLLAARGTQSDPELVCNMTISRENVTQITALTRQARQAGYDRIALEYVGQFEQSHMEQSRIGSEVPSPLFMRHGPSLLVEPQQVPILREQVNQALGLNNTQNSQGRLFRVEAAPFDVLSDKDLVEGTVPRSRCFMERTMIVIDPFGRIVPCLFFDGFSTADALNGGLSHTLETPRRRVFRCHRDAGKLALCNHCSMSLVRSGGWEVLRRAAVRGWQHPV